MALEFVKEEGYAGGSAFPNMPTLPPDYDPGGPTEIPGAAYDYEPQRRRAPAVLAAETPMISLYGQTESAGVIIYAGPRYQAVQFSKGSTYATDKSDYSVLGGGAFVDLRDKLYNYNQNAAYPRSFARLRPRTGLFNPSNPNEGDPADPRRLIRRDRFQLASTYDYIIVLSDGAMESWGTGDIELYIAQPDNEEFPQQGFVTLKHKTSGSRAWWEPDVADADDELGKALQGRLRVIPYLQGDTTNPLIWSFANTTYEVERWETPALDTTPPYDTALYKGSEFYRVPIGHPDRLKGLSFVHVIISNNAVGAYIDDVGIPDASRTLNDGTNDADSTTGILAPTNTPVAGYWNTWKGQPTFRFRTKGKKFSYPGQSSPVYTANAAAVRYDVERNIRGIPDSLIDAASVQAAITVANAAIQLKWADSPNANVPANEGGSFKRYEIHGAVTDYRENQLDWSWQGKVGIEHGQLVFLPGTLANAVRLRLDQDDITEIGNITLTPPLSDRTNTLTAGMVRSDRFRDYADVPLPDIVNATLKTLDGLELPSELGAFDLLDNFYRGLYLAHIYADLVWMREAFMVVVNPHTAPGVKSLAVRDIIEWNVPASYEMPFDVWHFKDTGQTYPLLYVVGKDTDPQTRAVTLTLAPLTGDPFTPDLKLAVEPGNLDVLALDSKGRYDFFVGPPINATITAFTDELKDGTHVNGILSTWHNRFGSIGTQVRLTNTTDATKVFTYDAGADATQLRQLDIEDATYKAEIRHQYPPLVGSTDPQWSDWLEVSAALVIGQDTTAPAAPTNLASANDFEGIDASWDYPTEKDYAYTRLWFGAQNNSTVYFHVKGDTLFIPTSLTGAQTLSAQHVDLSGNVSTATSINITITPKTADVDEVDRIYTRTNSETAPTIPTQTDTQRGDDTYRPTGWIRNKLNPTDDYRYVWESERTKAAGATLWTQFSTPTLYVSKPEDKDHRIWFLDTQPSITPANPADADNGDVVIDTSTGLAWRKFETDYQPVYRFNDDTDLPFVIAKRDTDVPSTPTDKQLLYVAEAFNPSATFKDKDGSSITGDLTFRDWFRASYSGAYAWSQKNVSGRFYAVCIDHEGNVCVLDDTNREIRVYSGETYGIIRSIDYPTGVTDLVGIDATTWGFITVRSNGSIWTYHPFYGWIASSFGGTASNLVDIARAGNGDLWVVSADAVWKKSTDGTITSISISSIGQAQYDEIRAVSTFGDDVYILNDSPSSLPNGEIWKRTTNSWSSQGKIAGQLGRLLGWGIGKGDYDDQVLIGSGDSVIKYPNTIRRRERTLEWEQVVGGGLLSPENNGSTGNHLRRTSTGYEWSSTGVFAPSNSGTTNQILTKTATEYEWKDAPTDFNPGNTGTAGQYLKKTATGYEWATIPTYTSFAPSNTGSAGQVLHKTSSGYEWIYSAGSNFDHPTLIYNIFQGFYTIASAKSDIPSSPSSGDLLLTKSSISDISGKPSFYNKEGTLLSSLTERKMFKYSYSAFTYFSGILPGHLIYGLSRNSSGNLVIYGYSGSLPAGQRWKIRRRVSGVWSDLSDPTTTDTQGALFYKDNGNILWAQCDDDNSLPSINAVFEYNSSSNSWNTGIALPNLTGSTRVVRIIDLFQKSNGDIVIYADRLNAYPVLYIYSGGSWGSAILPPSNERIIEYNYNRMFSDENGNPVLSGHRGRKFYTYSSGAWSEKANFPSVNRIKDFCINSSGHIIALDSENDFFTYANNRWSDPIRNIVDDVYFDTQNNSIVPTPTGWMASVSTGILAYSVSSTLAYREIPIPINAAPNIVASASFNPGNTGATGQYLKKTTAGYEWATIPTYISFAPSNNGSIGQVLTKTATGYSWQTASGGGGDFDLHDDVSTELTAIAGSDRFVVSDESETGDPNRYITWTNLKSDIDEFSPGNTGSTGQYLQKTATGYEWATIPSGSFSPGNTGSTGQYLKKTATGYEWDTIPTYTSFAPSNTGSAGQVLTKTATGYQWQAASGGFSPGNTGSTGQYLNKTATGYEWATIPTYTSFAPSNTGSTGQVLGKTATGYAWGTIRQVPALGNTGQVLTKTATGYSWQTPGEAFAPSNSGSNNQVLAKTSTGYKWSSLSILSAKQSNSDIGTSDEDIATGLANDDVLIVTVKGQITNRSDIPERTLIRRFGDIGTNDRLLIGVSYNQSILLTRSGTTLRARRGGGLQSAQSDIWKLGLTLS